MINSIFESGDRILIKTQSTASENGIYTVNASGAPTRATDFDDSSNIVNGAFIFVEEGTLNTNTGWALTLTTDYVSGSD